MGRMHRSWLCRWKSLWYCLSNGEFGVYNWHTFDLYILLLEIYPGKKIMNLYKIYHQDGLSQQEAVGCVNDAVSIKVNTVWFVKMMCRQCFSNQPLPSLRGSLSCCSGYLWWGCRRTIGGGKGQETGAGETGDFHPHFNQSSSTSICFLYVRLMGKLF